MSQPHQLPPPNSARLAITSLCKVLHHHGVTCLEPETVRQAKFDGPVAGPLWRALHDTVLLLLAGCPAGLAGGGALERQWSRVASELAGGDGEELPPEAAALVLHQLAAWGAPPALLQELRHPHNSTAAGGPFPPPARSSSSPPDAASGAGAGAADWAPLRVRSRPLLLALGWLVAAGRLFESRIGQLEPGPEARALLPPYPPDACVAPSVQAAYEAAAADAREHVRRLPAAAAAAGGGGGNGGAGSGLGRARAPAGDPFGPSPAALASEGLWVEVEAAAQRAVLLCGRVRAKMVALQAATDCRNRLSASLASRQAGANPGVRPLTPYELQLCAQPASVQRHMSALEAATLALLEQQELAAHGSLFFEWLGSVLEEEEGQAGGGGKGSNRQGGRSGKGGGAQAGGLSSLESLPPPASPAGARLGEHLAAQLAAALQAAEPELSAARRRLAAAGQQQGAAAAAAGGTGGVTLQHFLSLAERAVPEQLPDECEDGHSGEGGSGGGERNGGGGGGNAGPPKLPLLGCGAAAAALASHAGPWRLPDDVAAAVDAVHDAERRRQCTAEEEAERLRQLRYAALARYDFSPAAAATVAPPAPSTAASAADDTQRLLAAVLAAARPLARTRAGHKAALLAALQDLPDGYMVAGL